MLKLSSLRTRLVAAIASIVVAASAVLAGFSLSQQTRLTDQALDREMRSAYDSVIAAMDYEASNFLSLATMLAARPSIRAALAARDRSALLAENHDAYAALNKSFGIDVLQFTVPPAINFVRVHNPTLFGDDISARRKMVVVAQQTGEPQSGIEPSTTSLALFGMAPVLQDGRRVGFAEVGRNLNKPFVDAIRQRFGIDIAIHLYDGKAFSTIISTLPHQTTAGGAEFASVLRGNPLIRRTVLQGRPAAVYLGAIRNFSGEPVAVVEIVKDIANLTAIGERTRTLLIFAAVAIVLSAMALALLLSVGLSRPLIRVTATMARLSAGDTGVAVPGIGRRDEIGQIASAVQVFKESMLESAGLRAQQEVERERADAAKHAALLDMAETIEGDVSKALAEATARTASVAGTADDMSAAAARTDTSARSAAQAAAQALATAQTVASATEQLASSIREIAGQVNRSAEVASSAVSTGEGARATMQTLNQQVAQIGSVAEMISDIAAKTNLLALNATIEAARAGEAGKGFAVVAGEVKQLAAQTARSTEAINTHIGEVRAATNASVEAMDRIEQTINQMHAIASSIASAVQQQEAATAEIARNVSETAVAANAMTDRTTEFTAEAEAAGQQAKGLREHAASLQAAMRDLRQAVVRVVRTSSAEVDRRKAVRHPVDLRCTITSGAGGAQAGRVRDISLGGALVAEVPDLPAGARGTLQSDAIGFPVAFTVRASEPGALHLAFALKDADATRLAAVIERIGQGAAYRWAA